MKKILFSLLIILAGAATAGAFTASSWTNTDLPTGLTGKLSTNVDLYYESSTDQSGYIAATAHQKGSKTYASSSGDAAIYSADGTNVDPPSTVPTGTASATWGTSWSSL